MSEVTAPLPDPKLTPKPADAMAREGEREGPILAASAPPEEIETERDPQFAANGE